jgi:hypothetical protein
MNREKPKDVTHVTEWTWKHKDFDRLCPENLPGHPKKKKSFKKSG